MIVLAHEPSGFEGRLVQVEVDIRRGIPAVDLVGLAAGAVREARERVRAAVRNSGFEFPLDRVLINLAPADLPKAGPAYDLPIALAVLGASGALPDPGVPILALGELRLDGCVRPVRGVLPAVAAALEAGVQRFLLPAENAAEAKAVGRGEVYAMGRLEEATSLLARMRGGEGPPALATTEESPRVRPQEDFDLAELRGQGQLRRAIEIAAAGGHHLLLAGPPGSGKTMAIRRLPGILPDLNEERALTLASIRSLCGLCAKGPYLDRRPPFRSPHHSASLEGMIGGGRIPRPGEISLAHGGILFLDEASEFRADVLQSLREPIEEGRVTIVRAGSAVRYPAAFQLVLATNPCPCGNLGRPGRACLCSIAELQRYRRKIGGPLLDRIDIRVPVLPIDVSLLVGPAGEGSVAVRARIEAAARIQVERYRGGRIARNAELDPAGIERHCPLDRGAAEAFRKAVELLGLSSRACHSVLKVARTIADLGGDDCIGSEHILEAVQHRRYGEGDTVWAD